MSRSNLLTAFEEYLHINKALERNSIKSYLSDLEQLELFFPKDELYNLKTTDIFKFLVQFENKRTLNRKLSSINAFFDFCHKSNFTKNSINIPMAKVSRNLPKYLSLKRFNRDSHR